jgi:hypothetical protein
MKATLPRKRTLPYLISITTIAVTEAVGTNMAVHERV